MRQLLMIGAAALLLIAGGTAKAHVDHPYACLPTMAEALTSTSVYIDVQSFNGHSVSKTEPRYTTRVTQPDGPQFLDDETTSEVRVSGLNAGTTYSFEIRANTAGYGPSGWCAVGSRTTLAEPPPPPPPPAPPPPPPLPQLPHGIFSTSGASAPGIASLGFDFAWGYNRAQLDSLQANGLSALVFLGGINDATCTWNWSDDTVRTKVMDLRAHPATFGYYVADEPGGACATAVRDRNVLVKSLDPDHLTVITEHRTDDFDELAGTTDVMAIVTYPCNKVLLACRPTRVPDAIRAAEAAGVPHYWGVVQSFEDGYYRTPTPAELQWLLGQWHDSRAEGLIAYTWDCCGNDIGLRDHLELWPTWQAENGSAVHAATSN